MRGVTSFWGRWSGVALVMLLCGCGTAGATTDPRPASGTLIAADVARFVPQTHREGERVVLPLTFTDGTTAELVYPPSLELAERGVRPYGSGYLDGASATPSRSNVVGRDFRIFFGELLDVLDAVGGGRTPRLLARYAGVGGRTIGFWDVGDDVNYLAFQFGRWVVLVYDYRAGAAAMSDAERSAWAASFSGKASGDGFLLLSAIPPLRLARAGEHAGPELTFGSIGPPAVALYPGPCRPHQDQTRRVGGKLVQWSGGFADWCLSGSMRIHASGGDRFVGTLIRRVAVRARALSP
jgi:hypothetical protein